MRILALTSRRIESRQSGYDLRVAHLCAHLPGEAHLVVAPMEDTREHRPAGLAVDSVFESIEELPPVVPEREGVRRHLRLSNDHYLRLACPGPFALARHRLRQIVAERGITHVVAFGTAVAELASSLDDLTTVLDVCDSGSLTAERALASGAHPSRGFRRVQDHLALYRKRATESRLPARFDVVTTISAPDTRAVEALYGVSGVVHTVPNGIDEHFLRDLGEPPSRRGVAFWGNLGFGPNRDALWFFVHEVWRPSLRDKGVELCIVGPAAPRWLTDLAAEEPMIVMTGYVEDLPSVVGRYPIMINPMRTGSGLKNKVLEAFGLGVAVVTTPLGVEALPEVTDDVHAVSVADARGFGDAVLALLDDEPRRRRLREAASALVHDRYRWESVGRAWQALVAGETSRPRRSC